MKKSIVRTGSKRPIQLLNTEVARKIAAGEVIDRPASVLREFMDNALDSGADSITVDINGGGIDCVRVRDNGTGMTKDDLKNCAKPHSTSKITSEDDLQSLSTLGFRGEALASIAAVSRLEITSIRKGETTAYNMKAPLAGNGENTVLPTTFSEGTVVSSSSLFENIPARRLFLKRPAAETSLCKQIFVEKAMPFPEVAYKLNVDGNTRFNFPKNQKLTERFADCLEMPEKSCLFTKIDFTSSENTENSKQSFFGSVILGDVSLARNDKKLLFIFVNGRRVQEFSLIQAIEYGAIGFFPNGTHPIAALFLEIDSSLVDFNIHPAKKEVKFRDIAPIHHAVSSAVRSFYTKNLIHATNDFSLPEMNFGSQKSNTNSQSYKQTSTAYFSKESEPSYNYKPNYNTHSSYSVSPQKNSEYKNNFYSVLDTIKNTAPEPISTEELANQCLDEKSFDDDFVYLGQLFNVFLLIEKGNSLLLIDQHAGHERIRFNQLLENGSKKQKLLIPYRIQTQSEQENEYLSKKLLELESAGFEAEKTSEFTWEFSSVPITYQGTEADLRELLLEENRAPNEIMRHILATAACRSAIKEGHVLDSETAIALIKEILALPDPHCPHGRPIWIELTKDKLYELIKRKL